MCVGLTFMTSCIYGECYGGLLIMIAVTRWKGHRINQTNLLILIESVIVRASISAEWGWKVQEWRNWVCFLQNKPRVFFFLCIIDPHENVCKDRYKKSCCRCLMRTMFALYCHHDHDKYTLVVVARCLDPCCKLNKLIQLVLVYLCPTHDYSNI